MPPEAETPDDVVLPCGCLIRCVVVEGVNQLRISPCQTGCRNLANALDLAAQQGKPVEYRTGP
ncbi:MAG TPA: hypothetical protein VLL25_14830 [Acidimicrobiales bacterium]|nr:hypothetical protein [Acidimicrobiales bacterium]